MREARERCSGVERRVEVEVRGRERDESVGREETGGLLKTGMVSDFQVLMTAYARDKLEGGNKSAINLDLMPSNLVEFGACQGRGTVRE